MTRTRSEYRLSGFVTSDRGTALNTRPVADDDRRQLAELLLDAYRGTIDDEGEDLDDAFEAIDHYLEIIVRDHSIVVLGDDATIVAMSFVVIVEDMHYIDPVAVASGHRGGGLGRAAVITSLQSLATSGVDQVGATITDGNEPSERLFTGLGFERHGAWG